MPPAAVTAGVGGNKIAGKTAVPRAPGEKRPKQSFSCAECRRLKLKCSRVWPCTTCQRRGCAQICPSGEAKTGKGKRLILANTEELHERIYELEMALAELQAKISTAPHPLLATPYLYAPRDPKESSWATVQPQSASSTSGSVAPPIKKHAPRDQEHEDRLEAAFGMLTIGKEGQAKFVGSFAGSEYLREEKESEDEEENEVRVGAPQQGLRRSSSGQHTSYVGQAFTSPIQNPQIPGMNPDQTPGLQYSLLPGSEASYDIEGLRAQLPDYDVEGRSLVESYWENVNWQYQPIPRKMFENDHILNAYDTESPVNAHKLACVFLVMALGASYDLNRVPYHPRSEVLYLLGRACISTSGTQQASPATVQALHLMGTYILDDKSGNGAEVFWPILGTAIKVAQSIGLHRDGSHFGLSQYEVEERRVAWWDIVSIDKYQSLCFGRPSSTSGRWSDTKLPEVLELIEDETGFHRSRYQLMKLMERAIEIQTQIEPVSFSVVIDLDHDLQNYKKNLPANLMPDVPILDMPTDSQGESHLVIHRFAIRLQIAQTRLLLNRPLFARALKESPQDPARNAKLGESFLALFDSALEIVQLVKALVIYNPRLIARWWFFWFHAFSAAVCLAAIAIQAPTCAYATPAFQAMSIVCDISAAAREGCRARKGLPMLLRLRQRALNSLTSAVPVFAMNGMSRQGPPLPARAGEEDEDDLSHLAGGVKLRRKGVAGLDRWSPSEEDFSPGLGNAIKTVAALFEGGPFESNTVPGLYAHQASTMASFGDPYSFQQSGSNLNTSPTAHAAEFTTEAQSFGSESLLQVPNYGPLSPGMDLSMSAAFGMGAGIGMGGMQMIDMNNDTGFGADWHGDQVFGGNAWAVDGERGVGGGEDGRGQPPMFDFDGFVGKMGI
ncbi:hypothetical protein L198_00980 [Cryptococcus wingfieldii CBS 7118]|uniref:Zn(2)-C6 fungal-type domain-containing protein n=1 Tax=Cryptococcus wingfieldii CBS 7118 TaxID=1295528 RepID=A0A1E3K2Z6_9TREE|nr:hypothetical protein L198_00980 [Cryptococcus wingfieldii CBS 7118]ODO07401.1 hypothetical protein L198_00980 [Cryptococcus wingfieldii CBS 7118]